MYYGLNGESVPEKEEVPNPELIEDDNEDMDDGFGDDEDEEDDEEEFPHDVK